MRRAIPWVDPDAYRPSWLHDADRRWPETNCYVDLLIEVLNATGNEPAAALGFTVEQDFEGDHFTFFKFITADLRKLFGLDIEELAVFDRIEDRILTQIDRGRLPMVEVDAFYLPDTRGVSYRVAHSKSSIGINALDPAGRRMEYFHNAGYFLLEGEDFDALFPVHDAASGLPLFPYSEFMKLGRSPASADDRGGGARAAGTSSGQAAGIQSDPRLCRGFSGAFGGIVGAGAGLFSHLRLQHVAPARRQFRAAGEPSRLAGRQRRARAGARR